MAATAVPTEQQLRDWVTGLAGDRSLAVRTSYKYDLRGELKLSVVYTELDATGEGVSGTGATTQYVYNERGELLQTITPDGRGITQTVYDGMGRVVSSLVKSADGTLSIPTVSLYDDAGGKISVTLANNLVRTSTFDGAGRLVSVVESSAGTTLGTTRYSYDADNRLVMTQGPTGQRSWVLYDAAGRKVADVGPAGSLTEYVYDAANQLTQIIGYANPVTVSLLVDANGNPTSPALSAIRPAATSADAKTWNLYDAAGRLTHQVDALGYVTQTRFDEAGRVLSTTQYANAVSTAALGNGVGATVAPVASAADRTITRLLDKDGLLRGTIDGEGYLTELRYDSAGRQVQTIGYASKVRGFTDAANIAAAVTTVRSGGNVASLVDADAAKDISTWTYYDARGQKVAAVDAEGYLTELTYDSNGRLSESRRYASKVTATLSTFTSLSTLRPAANGEDHFTRNTWDALGRLLRQVTADGLTTDNVYDAVGNLISTTVAAGTVDQRILNKRYDVQGRLVAELTAVGAALLTSGLTPAQVDDIWAQYGVKYAYDAAGRRISTTDQNGNRTVFFHDDAGRLRYTVNALGEVAETAYDALGRVTSTSALATRLPAATVTSLVGGVLSSSANAGAATALVTAVAASTQNSLTRIEYDARGQRTATVDALNVRTTATYDAFGGVVQTTQPTNAGTLGRTSTFDRRGLATRMVEDPSGLAITRSSVYDAFGRLIQTTDANGVTIRRPPTTGWAGWCRPWTHWGGSGPPRTTPSAARSPRRTRWARPPLIVTRRRIARRS
ncbi:MAG: hypothetical protein QM767_05870 [Anaeromyxobacter sp.]